MYLVALGLSCSTRSLVFVAASGLLLPSVGLNVGSSSLTRDHSQAPCSRRELRVLATQTPRKSLLSSIVPVYFHSGLWYFFPFTNLGLCSFSSSLKCQVRLFEILFLDVQAFIVMNLLGLLLLSPLSFSMLYFHFHLSQVCFYFSFVFFYDPLVVQ